MKININIEADYSPDACPPFRRRKILREYSAGDREKFLTTQHERDSETGLDYRGARFYDSDNVKFLSLDPLAVDYPSYSDYAYVVGNPIMYTDPTGTTVESDYYDENNNYLGHVEDGSNQKIYTTKSEWDGFKSAADNAGLDISRNLEHGSTFTSTFREHATFEKEGGLLATVEVGSGSSKASSGSDFSNSESAVTTGGLLYGTMQNILVNNGQWLGKNGKYNSLNWGGNGSTGARSFATGASKAFNVAGQGVFFVGAIYSGFNGVNQLSNGNYSGASKSGLDIGMSAVGTYGGVPGLIISGAYFTTDAVMGKYTDRLKNDPAFLKQELIKATSKDFRFGGPK